MAIRISPACTTSARAAAHRAMAKAALFSDSSASNRLKRYNHHMTQARDLEGQEEPSQRASRKLTRAFDTLRRKKEARS